MIILRKWPSAIGYTYQVLSRWTGLVACCLFLLVNTCLESYGQCGTTAPAFSISPAGTKICAGTTITVTTTNSLAQSVFFVFDYKGGAIPATGDPKQLTYQYTTPGSYTILQVGSINGSGFSTCRTITVMPSGRVQFSVVPCSSRKVLLKPDWTSSPDAQQYNFYIVDWGDGPPERLTRAQLENATHTYTGTGLSFGITITGSYNDGTICTPLPSERIQVNLSNATSQNPLITSVSGQTNAVEIKYTIPTGGTAQLQQSSSANGTYQTIVNNLSATGTYNAASTGAQQCFQLTSNDACGNISFSDRICTILPPVVTPTSGQNSLQWGAYTGSGSFRQYRVLKNGVQTGSLIASRSIITANDNVNIQCNTQYCYSVEATVTSQVISGQLITITSAPTCVTGINTAVPAKLTPVLATIQDGKPRVQAVVPLTGNGITPASYTLLVGRSEFPGAPVTPYGSREKSNVFVDSEADPAKQPYCYQVSYLNSCGLQSPQSDPVCTIHLTSAADGTLEWSSLSPFSDGRIVYYTLQVQDETGALVSAPINLGSNTRYEPNLNDPKVQTYRYVISAYSNSGVASNSNLYILNQDPKIVAPTAFTPNGDTKNDTFSVLGLFWQTFHLTVYSRWGEPVFSTTDKDKGWDGTYNGQPAPEGQYIYKVEVEDLNGRRTVKTGSVMLIR